MNNLLDSPRLQDKHRQFGESLVRAQQRSSVPIYLSMWLTAGQRQQAECMADLLRGTCLCNRAWDVWRKYCAERARKAEMSQCARTHDIRRTAKASFSTWLLHIAAQAQHSLALLLAEAHDQERCTGHWFYAWRTMLVERQHYAAIQHRTAAVFNDCYIASICFGWWRRWVCY